MGARLRDGRSDRIDWTSDGMNVNGVLTYPPGFTAGKQYPLVLVIHGGPVATSTTAFSALAQMLAAHGMLVLQPNYRGSDNSGDAFVQAIVGPVTSGPGRDNLAGVEAVKKLGIVDPARNRRVGLVGRRPADVVADRSRDVLARGAQRRRGQRLVRAGDARRHQRGVRLRSSSAARRRGPPKGARSTAPSRRSRTPANVRTPTLILTDSSDQRVPITQSFAFYRALQATRRRR